MTVSTIFDACRPRADVLKGNIAEADFAADLAQVILGRGGSDEYIDPVRFFANTYPTRGLKDLLANVCRRLAGSGDEVAAIFRLDTSYGGGKTHGLIALTHAARGMQGVSNIDEFVDPALLPRGRVRVAAFDGENADPANGRAMGDGVLAYTPWGEIAYALAGQHGYQRVRNSDESRIAPGAETLRELFGGEPTLILLDELSVYLRKVRYIDAARDQLTAFPNVVVQGGGRCAQRRAGLHFGDRQGRSRNRCVQRGESVHRGQHGRSRECLRAQSDALESHRGGRNRPGAASPPV